MVSLLLIFNIFLAWFRFARCGKQNVIKVIRNTNPHAVPDLDFYVSTFPLICYPENVNYLVFSFTEN